MSLKTSIFVQKAKKNKKYKRVVSMFEDKGAYAFDYQKDIDRINNFHSSRKIRTIKAKELLTSFAVHSTEVNLQEQAYRSSIVEIKMKYFRISNELEDLIKDLRNYLATNYRDQLRSEFTTDASRTKALDYLTSRFETKKKRYSLVVSLADIVIDDIDQGGWRVKHTTDAMNIASKDK